MQCEGEKELVCITILQSTWIERALLQVMGMMNTVCIYEINILKCFGGKRGKSKLLSVLNITLSTSNISDKLYCANRSIHTSKFNLHWWPVHNWNFNKAMPNNFPLLHELHPEGFEWLYITLRITQFLELVHHPVFQKQQHYFKLDLFLSPHERAERNLLRGAWQRYHICQNIR
jgi:hypothetical protein